ncbi:hypothetical protein [Mesorhizobium sp. CO1-1-8]|uniref:hypothetical protein n=1 Tax=Mesorhizobium sp. CO1-1-8 TaxID=2876631 RepID=UPI001CD10297|nr:hypothetical protein [Mesorhizobium sp. CO1-1-8]MBZ9772257.1 hypothetical protein [Mesorhizobium sp. CO1-1-8]
MLKVFHLAAPLLLSSALLHGAAVAAPAHNYCQSSPLRSDAVDFPSKHAWDLFLMLNHPALDRAIARGQPDCTKPIGLPGSTAVWESWRNAGKNGVPGEVFLKDGVEPPDWNDNSLKDEKPGSVPAAAVDAISVLGNMEAFASSAAGVSFHDLAIIDRKHPQFSPGDGVFEGHGAFGETRMNRATYEFIRKNCLWSANGLQRYAKAFLEGKKLKIEFPPDSIEVKAAWIDFEAQNVPKDRWDTYYVAEYNGRKFGLETLHVLTKDIPNWFWASFHHKDQLSIGSADDPIKPGAETEDTFGRPKILDGTVWQNYVLGGTQIEFETSLGVPTQLSDAVVEKGFVRSSCITCHATATISATAGSIENGQQKAICLLTPDSPDVGLDYKACRKLIGDRYFVPNKDELVTERGAPLPEWYYDKSNNLAYLPSDFLYSIPQRAQAEASSPPGRCIW